MVFIGWFTLLTDEFGKVKHNYCGCAAWVKEIMLLSHSGPFIAKLCTLHTQQQINYYISCRFGFYRFDGTLSQQHNCLHILPFRCFLTLQKNRSSWCTNLISSNSHDPQIYQGWTLLQNVCCPSYLFKCYALKHGERKKKANCFTNGNSYLEQ